MADYGECLKLTEYSPKDELHSVNVKRARAREREIMQKQKTDKLLTKSQHVRKQNKVNTIFIRARLRSRARVRARFPGIVF